MIDFNNRVAITGYGIVAQALLPMLLKHVRMPLDGITIIDLANREPLLAPWLGPDGVRFVAERVTPANLPRLLSSAVGRGGLLIDLTWSIDFFDVVEWAHNNEVLYVNASLESWDPAAELHSKRLVEKAMYPRYVQALELAARWKGQTTAVIDHGTNPGLISSFVKKGLLAIGERLMGDPDTPVGKRELIERFREEQDFARLARELDVRVIHCSEHDTQTPLHPKAPNEFVGTWSIEGMWEESVAPCELGWGTHERTRPHASVMADYGPQNSIVLPRMGMNTWVRSWVPHHEIVGTAITHGECFSVSHALTVRDGETVQYRPTVLYAYLPCGESFLSWQELRCRNYELQPARRILTHEIVSGGDSIGALIMGHKYQSWWTGSMLTIEEARRMIPNVNATAVQVAAGVLAGALWAIRNPRRGLCFPEDLPHEDVLRAAGPYLGNLVSEAVEWTPLSGYRTFFPENPAAAPVWSDPWQFSNFVFRP